MDRKKHAWSCCCTFVRPRPVHLSGKENDWLKVYSVSQKAETWCHYLKCQIIPIFLWWWWCFWLLKILRQFMIDGGITRQNLSFQVLDRCPEKRSRSSHNASLQSLVLRLSCSTWVLRDKQHLNIARQVKKFPSKYLRPLFRQSFYHLIGIFTVQKNGKSCSLIVSSMV